jgi:FdhD protein
MGHLIDRRRILRVRGAGGADLRAQEQPDQLAVEAPLTLRVGNQTVATTMRTPGHDLELALGWLVAEGVTRRPGDVLEATSCDTDTVQLRLAPGVTPPKARLGATSSACGVCGSDTIAEVLARRGPMVVSMGVVAVPGATPDPGPTPTSGPSPMVDAEVITRLPDRLRAAQRGFARTGGLHAAGLFTAEGDVVCVREDVGRHNAVDKVVGWAFTAGLLPASSMILQVSGRASFELTQKAAMAGIPVLSAVSAPSTLAVDLAEEAGLTLIGFVRGDSMNVYAGAERLSLKPSLVSPR